MISLIFTLNAQALEKVSLQLKWKYQFQFSGFIMAKEKGFYKDIRLDVELKEYDKNTNTIKDVISGKSTFGINDSSLILETMKGKPIVGMMAILQESPNVLMGLKSSGIKKLEDLNNKNLVLNKDVSAITVLSMLKSNHINYKSNDVIFRLDKLISKEIDMTTAYITNEPFVTREKGLDIVIFNPKDYGFDSYGDILFTSQDRLKNHPRQVRDFYEASKKGWEYAFNHIDETVDLIYSKYNTLDKSKKALIYEANVLKTLTNIENNFGNIDQKKIKSIALLLSFMVNGKYDLKKLDNFIYKPNANQLSSSELQWLNQKNRVRIRVANSAPYQINENGKFEGISVDYIEKIFKKYNIKYKFISSTDIGTWNQALESIRDKKNLDLLLAVKKIPSRQKDMLFTDDYISSPWVIFTRDDFKFISGIKDLEGKKVAVENGFVIHKILQTKYPKINIDIKKGQNPTIQALESLAIGEVDAFVGNLTSGSYISKSLSLDNIKVAAPTPFGNHKNAMAIRDDWSPLVSIINRELNAMSIQDKNKIFNKYLSIQYEYGISFWDVVKWIGIVTVIFLIIVIVITLSNRRLNKEIKKTIILKNELNELNLSLENRVKDEVYKNEKHQALMMEQSKLAQMGEMIENIAHQWRQPLAQVNSSILIIDAVLQRNSFENELINAKLLEVEELTEHMSHTIDDFQHFFNPNKEKTFFFLREIIDKSMTIVQGVLSSNFTIVEINVDETLGLKGFPLELQQVLVVLLSNANDALKIRKIRNPKIIVDVEDNAETYLLSISDNAGGIHIDKLEQIFEPYYTTKHKSRGTGVGLYMAKMIIEEGMKGKLSVANKNNGAYFSIKILKERNNER